MSESEEDWRRLKRELGLEKTDRGAGGRSPKFGLEPISDIFKNNRDDICELSEVKEDENKVTSI